MKKPGVNKNASNKFSSNKTKNNKIVAGLEYRLASLLIGMNVVWLALLRYKNPWRAFHLAAKVINTRDQFKTTHPKIAKRANKYYMNLHTPGWPSKAFNRGIHHSFNLVSQSPDISLFSVVFAITNKCGFQCEHCVEWENLNRKDSLSAYDLVTIIRRFHHMGISQVHLSGGEPLNRLDDILFILDSVPEGIDFWVFTNGYNLSAEKAARLKEHGMTGVIISLDHHEQERHDQFRGIRGSYQRALQSAQHVVDSGLLLAFSCCATNEFISMNNLESYASVCREAGASFIQFLEPEAVGHYRQKNVALNKKNKELLEHFFYRLNFDASYSGYPIASYPAMIKRHNGCPASGLHFVYIDADGFVHACPFNKKKLFPASSTILEKNIRSLRETGCSMIEFTSKSKDSAKTLQLHR
ncbi:radical SAM protein [Ginsengibacter hankyongi]|nr:radical SAM protein [Ginsengibacter hankyongi]